MDTNSSPPDLVVLCPTRGRPRALAPLAQAFAAVTTGYRMLFIVDDDDRESQAAADLTGEDWIVSTKTGFPAKVNLGIRHSTEPLIFLGSDDVKPHPHWRERAEAAMTDELAYVSCNDLGNKEVMRGDYATMVLVARWYAELDEEFYPECYLHNAVDLEASALAKKRGAFVYVPDAIVEHLHPNYGKAEMDETYRRWAFDEDGVAADRALLEERRALWA
jgi:hypothetical protein